MRHLISLVLVCLVIGGCASQAEREEKAAKLNKRVEIHTQLGATYLSRNQLDIAQQELQHSLDINPDDSQANHIMGLLQLRLKQDDKAEQHFRRAIGEQPGNSDAHNSYGVFLCERGRLDEADEQFRAAINNPLYKTPEQASLNAGICQLKKPDKNAAAAYFRTTLRHNPRQPLALLHMARHSFETGESLSARGFMQRYFEVAKDTPDALLLAFRIERVLGAKDAQATYALRLRGKFPHSAEAKQLRTLTGK
ncbi:MAG: type IV pilus biogenesis/stability protein PilW [Candidatus Muproteobacteria bacterium RBG_19FT_COMBO_61_10]|uniref:Type IV pilus biogenesis/stability protein PilW n=1 Tax=Candidatus Muproteobacteria bacterium RBG_19FT_COMBO_61_10 TaxID=1817761 RepID=A0A1F6UKT4_9PROT|nr:MAG: type IV pilus biogenesis/stability protein PilW [Candidatus Muproteobacteria bacterium RBG_19FT_COMBO_61_10]